MLLKLVCVCSEIVPRTVLVCVFGEFLELGSAAKAKRKRLSKEHDSALNGAMIRRAVG